MKKNERKKYEEILMNSITKEGSKWEFDETDHFKGKFADTYRHYYRIRVSDNITIRACVEYDTNTNKYQVVYLSRHTRSYSNFRWLGYLYIGGDDYLDIR